MFKKKKKKVSIKNMKKLIFRFLPERTLPFIAKYSLLIFSLFLDTFIKIEILYVIMELECT